MAQKTKEIDGITFQVAPFMAVEGLRLKAFFVKSFGPALGSFVGSIGDIKALKNINSAKIDGKALAEGIEKLMEHLSEDQFLALLKRLFANVIARWTDETGKPHSIAFNTDFNASMEAVFSGKLFSIYPVIGFILEVNYPDFFDKVVRSIGTRIQKIQTSGPEELSLTSESPKSEKLDS